MKWNPNGSKQALVITYFHYYMLTLLFVRMMSEFIRCVNLREKYVG